MLSIALPTSEYGGLSSKFLVHNFEILRKQTFRDFEIVITDNSKNHDIEHAIFEYADLRIKYFRNKEDRGMTVNTNNAISRCSGELIKILFLDDFFYSRDSLKHIVDNFKPKDNWLVTACEHSKDGVTMERPFYPWYNDAIHLGKNTISSPSVLTIRNKGHIKFDENLIWLMDCDYYKRLYSKFGPPKIVKEINVVNRIGQHQTTYTLPEEQKRKEIEYLLNKYAETA